MSRLQIALCVSVLLCFAASALAAPRVPDNMGALAYQGPSRAEFNKVIKQKCTLCHTREPVDVAIREHKDEQEIQNRMIGHGAQLTERDKEVLGVFWGDPLKGEATTAPPPTAPASLK